MIKAPIAGPKIVPMPPTRFMRTTSVETTVDISVSVAMPKITVFSEAANPASAAEMAKEIEADAADAEPGEPFQLLIGLAAVQQRNPPIAAFAPLQRVQHGAVVGAVTGRLHQHRTLDPLAACSAASSSVGVSSGV